MAGVAAEKRQSRRERGRAENKKPARRCRRAQNDQSHFAKYSIRVRMSRGNFAAGRGGRQEPSTEVTGGRAELARGRHGRRRPLGGLDTNASEIIRNYPLAPSTGV